MATTTTPLDRLRDAVEDLRHALSDIEYELDEFEKPEPDARVCECRHPRKWHWPNKETYCLSPDCPCRKFEPAGGDA
jgi:hypothetical protein